MKLQPEIECLTPAEISMTKWVVLVIAFVVMSVAYFRVDRGVGEMRKALDRARLERVELRIELNVTREAVLMIAERLERAEIRRGRR